MFLVRIIHIHKKIWHTLYLKYYRSFFQGCNNATWHTAGIGIVKVIPRPNMVEIRLSLPPGTVNAHMSYSSFRKGQPSDLRVGQWPAGASVINIKINRHTRVSDLHEDQ
jgi:hypothetical protein